MKSASGFYVFDKWKNAPVHAFGSQNQTSLVPPEDKAAYASIFDELTDAATYAIEEHAGSNELKLRPMGYSAEYGSRGHRPVDLWVSICRIDAETFGYFPQLYVIASDRGLEVGFAASIDEADYYNAEVKAKNRIIVPLLNSKLPPADSETVQALGATLDVEGGWHFNRKTRLSVGAPGFDYVSDLKSLVTLLRTTRETSGGGAICRVLPPSELGPVDLRQTLLEALTLFYPLMVACAPTTWDDQIVQSQDDMASLAQAAAAAFDPSDVVDARKRVLTEVARRLGQAAFRRKLVKAYQGTCAITGNTVLDVLQAAHITPYLGTATNDVTNGILLRADLHTLFDLRLIRINPTTLVVEVSEVLADTPYGKFNLKPIKMPSAPSQRPSVSALAAHYGSSI